MAVAIFEIASTITVSAQGFTFSPRPAPTVRSQPRGGEQQMVVRAAEINYDYTNERVSAVGNVQLYYGDSTLEADRVIYCMRRATSS